jgi:3-carboxy-cis,cis-muconate cycloisomerase
MSSGHHRLLWSDPEIGSFFAQDAEVEGFLRFEAALAKAQAECGLIRVEAAKSIADACESFRVDIERLRAGITRDGMIVPDLVGQLRETLPALHQESLHFRSTSQDVIDTINMMAFKSAAALISGRLNQIVAQLDRLDRTSGSVPQMARTRMQRALPLTLSARVSAWCAPLQRHLHRVAELESRVFVLQLGGPIGTEDSPWAKSMADLLGLGVPARSWHTARDLPSELASWATMISGSLGKIGLDIAMMAQNEVGEVKIEGGGKSSAMHHKSNPVDAELLISIARYSACLVSGIHHAELHEQERSGSAWALEWMILPDLLEVTGAATLHCLNLLKRSTFMAGTA